MTREQQRECRRNSGKAGRAFVLHPLQHQLRESEVVFEREPCPTKQMAMEHRVPIREVEREHAQRMVTLIQDDELRRDIGEAARRRAAEFSWQRVSARTLELYDSICAGARAAQQPEPGPPRLDTTIEQLLERLEPDSRRIVMNVLSSTTDSARTRIKRI